jgi:DNA-binding NtrC family response regulator
LDDVTGGRVLDSRLVTRVGSNKPRPLDIRLICATNKPLKELAGRREFREDLLYRINTVEINLPPLRERSGDIPLLARHFMARGAAAARIQPREFGEDALAALQAYTWPGNVRQLRNVVDWLLIMAPGDAGESVHADMRKVLGGEPAIRIDYLALCDPDTLEPLERINRQAVILGAVRLGSVRLIDNVLARGKKT